MRDQEAGLNMLIGLGEGSVDSITDVEINDDPIGKTIGSTADQRANIGTGDGTKYRWYLPHGNVNDSTVVIYFDDVAQNNERTKVNNPLQKGKDKKHWKFPDDFNGDDELIQMTIHTVQTGTVEIDASAWGVDAQQNPRYSIKQNEKGNWILVLDKKFEKTNKDLGIYAEYWIVSSPTWKFIEKRETMTKIKFMEPPANGVVITASYEISKFGQTTYETRLGTSDQKIIDGFDDLRQTYDVGKELNEAVEETETTNQPVDNIVLGFVAPRGLLETVREKEGDIKYFPQTVGVDIYIRKTEADRASIFGQTTQNGDLKWVQLYNSSTNEQRFKFRGKTTSAKQFEVDISSQHYLDAVSADFLPVGDEFDRDYYEIKIVRTDKDKVAQRIQDDLNWAYITEVRNEKLNYPNTALLAIKATATENISGGIPKVTCVVKGRQVKNLDTEEIEWSNNPAWCVADLITNKRYGLGDWYTEDNLDTASFTTWATWCDANDYKMDALVDSAYGALELLALLATSARGILLITAGNTWKVLIDKDTSVSQTFSDVVAVPEFIADSLTYGKTTPSKQPNRLEIRFVNEDKDYEPDVLLVEDSSQIDTAGGVIRSESVKILGATRFSQVKKVGLYMINALTTGAEWVKFDAPISAITSEAGDVISITHSLPGWTAREFRIFAAKRSSDDKVSIVGKRYSTTVYPENMEDSEVGPTSTNANIDTQQTKASSSSTGVIDTVFGLIAEEIESRG